MRVPMRAPAAFREQLAEVGVSVGDPWDLVKTRNPHPAAVPVLIEWLDRAGDEVPAHERGAWSGGAGGARGVRAEWSIRPLSRAVGNTLAALSMAMKKSSRVATQMSSRVAK
jgi:hypothetical protein